MDYERKSVIGILSFDVSYKLTGAESRKCPYLSGGKKYEPMWLRFKVTSNTPGTHPSYDNLAVTHATLYGCKLKQDGTTGLAECKEEFYNLRDAPPWIKQIAEECVKELQAHDRSQ